MKPKITNQSNLVNHAIGEFTALGWINEDGEYTEEMQGHVCDDLIALLTLFSEQGHSGSSAPYAIHLFEKLAMFKPIAPLTGADSEWNEVAEGVFQNVRCSTVFKEATRFDGQAYNIEGIVFYDVITGADGMPSRSYFTNSDSCVPITFPYVPEIEYREYTATK